MTDNPFRDFMDWNEAADLEAPLSEFLEEWQSAQTRYNLPDLPWIGGARQALDDLRQVQQGFDLFDGLDDEFDDEWYPTSEDIN